MVRVFFVIVDVVGWLLECSGWLKVVFFIWVRKILVTQKIFMPRKYVHTVLTSSVLVIGYRVKYMFVKHYLHYIIVILSMGLSLVIL